MTKKEKMKASIPKWIGNHPCIPEEKKPVIITKDMELSTLYGFQGSQVEFRFIAVGYLVLPIGHS